MVNPPANARDKGEAGSIPGSGRSPGEGNGKPTPVFLGILRKYLEILRNFLGNPMDRGAWQATVHGVAKSQTQLGMHTPQCSAPTVSVQSSGFWHMLIPM